MECYLLWHFITSYLHSLLSIIISMSTIVHRRWKGPKVGGAEVAVVAAKVDPRRGGLGAQPPDADEGIISYNSKVFPK